MLCEQRKKTEEFGGWGGGGNCLLLYVHALCSCYPLWWCGEIVLDKRMLLDNILDFGDNSICTLPESSFC